MKTKEANMTTKKVCSECGGSLELKVGMLCCVDCDYNEFTIVEYNK